MIAIIAQPVYAIENPTARVQSNAAQTQTIRALQTIDQGQWTLGERMIANTRDPLAAKLFRWLEFTQKENVTSYPRLVQFIRHNPEWPGIQGMTKKAEAHMPRNANNAEIIAWFKDYEPKTAEGLDRYIGALVNAGRRQEAEKIIRKWWADMTLTRDEQKSIYRKYSGLIDRNAHRRRLDALLFSKQYSNARAIAGVLSGGYPALTEARIALAAEKKNVNALINKIPASLKNDPGLIYERIRWRRRNDLNDGAITLLQNPPAFANVQNPKAWWRERHIIIRRMLEKRDYKTAYALADGHIQQSGFSFAQAEWLSGWIALRFLNKPTNAYQHFETLYQNVSTPVSKARAAYWAGRASEGFADKAISNTWYKNAARFQTVYYGQLAGAKLGMEQSLPNAAPPLLTRGDKAEFNKRELLQGAQLFHAAGMRKEATRFLKAFVANEDSAKAYRYAAETAIAMKSYGDAVRIAKDATKKGLFLTAQAYPIITNQLTNVETEWALVHGLIRQESQFDVRAKSRVGAQGLMQLMPATAKETARKLGIPHQQSWLYLRPSHNIKLGTAYLDQMLRRFDYSYPLAIAAYNAGPGRVDRWLEIYGDPRKREIDWIDWIELVPIYETRNYIQRVMESVYVYRLRLKGQQKGFQQPIHIALSR